MLGLMLQQGFNAHQSGDLDKAASLFKAVLHIDPRNFDALHLLGLLAADRGKHDDALQLIGQALAINPRFAPAHANLASSLRQLKRYEDALRSAERALKLDPRSVEAHNIRGNILRLLGRLEEALSSLDRALQLQPDFIEAHDNRGSVLRELGRLDEALASYEAARRINPHYASACWNESLCRLLLGDFARGWPLYEAGWQLGLRSAIVRTEKPRWTGAEPLHGKTILLLAEQGLGDTLQFCRYARELTQYGARVVLEVQTPLKGLLSNLEAPGQLIAQGETRPDFDYYCPLLSLPLALQTVQDAIPRPAQIQMDAATLSTWQARIASTSRLRVGIAWSGNSNLANDHNRSIPLAQFAALFDCEATFFSLQKDIRPQDRDFLDAHPNCLQQFETCLTDFTDTAALIAQLDLVISVDTAVAHLSATLGKPTWVLLPYIPDWRWGMGADNSAWYPTARLFRQTAARDWREVFEMQVKSALTGLSANSNRT